MKRVFIIVLDSFGIGGALDAASFHDEGADTLRSCAAQNCFSMPNLLAAGLGNIDGITFLPKASSPAAAFGRMREKSMGKDTTIGHWELAGIISSAALPTYPNGFPPEILKEFSRRTGRGILCNMPYSGTDVIRDFGDEHIKTGKLIVYTSADSVFQIAAHENVVSIDELYRDCKIARALLCGEHGVGRVIARPFVTGENGFVRTSNRHDFSLLPPKKTLLDALFEAGMDVISIGKITDIFAGRGITESRRTKDNRAGMQLLLETAKKDFHGLCFANLVDFDMIYGHRNNACGYAAALSEFDAFLPNFLSLLGKDDALFVTADHGCDPGDASTDHTREDVPVIVFGKRILPINLKTRESFADLGKSVADMLGVSADIAGKSFFSEICEGEKNRQ